MKLVIGLSRGSGSPKYENYRRWLSTADDYDIRTIDLFTGDLDAGLGEIDGLILTGGGDINPTVYDMPEALDLCDGIDQERDRREKVMFDYCVEQKIPVLGICRGLQYITVHLGGKMIPHIPDDPEAGGYHTNVQGEDNNHEVSVEPGSLLFRTVGVLQGEVNSSHHQGVRAVPPELAVTATAPDGMVEGIEWKEPEQKNYMVAVQWHPERMEPASPFSGRLLEAFLLEAASACILKRSSLPLPREEEGGEEEGPDRDDESDGTFQLPIVQ